MLDHTDPVASIIPAMSLDSPSDNAMTALSRLALGPVNTAYYMAVFERFDNTGRTTTTWNWAACLATLNWMLFRQLWTPALVYLAAAEGLALIVYGIGRTFLQWPPGVELGVLGAFAMLAFAVPGLYGNAILYADIRKRVARALAASRTLPEACVLLEKQASSRKRLQALVLANLVLVAAATLAYLVWAPSDTKPLALEPAVTVAQATAAASRPSAAASAPAAAITAAPSPAPAPAPAPASAPVPVPVPAQEPPTPALPATTASAPDPAKPAAAPPTVKPAATANPAPKAAAPASTPARSSEANRPAPAAASAASTVSKTPSSAPATAAPKPSAKTTPPAEPASRAASAAKAKTPKASASAAAPASSAPLPTVGTAAGYYINVGLFADEANARKAQARLLNEGLPAFRQELNNAKGRRIRVRVGPYESRAKAEAAAASIRAMALEAVVFKQ
ncbi:cell division septation protein DedD [Acidovorax sp. 93]|uniref:SPOR domain-containing protein n=1 Tax=Acidovorax sp. 93 TaxID=2135632 RepID=UPI000EB5E0C4|nr:SPOR domain-containing protein [Acidovorax sp. 93]RKR29646.1 cell division septation protein DedD [Acidovorax sp. 93]